MRPLSFTLIAMALLHGCGDSDPTPDSGNARPDAGDASTASPDASDAGDADVDDASDGGDPSDAEEPLPSGPPVPQGPPNVPEFDPAFPGQTRAPAIESQTALEVTEIAAGFKNPWAIAFLPDQRMLVTEKATGSLYVVTPQGAKSPAVSGLPAVDARSQGGLLDVEVGPDYAESGLIYWTYAEPREGGNGLTVARGRLVDGTTPSVEDVQVIFRMTPTLDSTLHFGGRMVFTPDGYLFVTLGERSILAGRAQAQDLTSHLGKVIRIRPDGAVPENNPYVSAPGALPEIWSIGHRNVQAATLDADGRLWIVEMGPQGGDELNLVEGGNDYGWPTIGYGEEYSGAAIHTSPQAEGMEQPVYYWDPVVAPSGMVLYTGTLFPEWRGNIFFGALSGKALVRLRMHGDRVVGEEHLLESLNARIREVAQGPDGALYLLTDATNGRLLRVTPL